MQPEEAFGEHEKEGVFTVARDGFPNPESVQLGDEFIAPSPEGDEIAIRVIEILPDAFKVDTNHPLAGQTVRFQVEVCSVRPASAEELEEAQNEMDHEGDHDGACGCGHEHAH
ncbi:FKBP-type peptidyl-prolyl cis-trans isomerase [Chondromyces crocatus]|uniref:FKBP-type peptidyl-prolyl cis-trans isomerase n=1 Tax=Chondromyces crocatus TaxID=52 RepID=UPI001FDFD32A|nr:hypothetical protein [Chondromyces crocatus]